MAINACPAILAYAWPGKRTGISLTRQRKSGNTFDRTDGVCYGKICSVENHQGGGQTISQLALFLFAGQWQTLIEQTGWVARAVLLILLCFSLLSWAIIFQKWVAFGRADAQTRRFLKFFRSGRSLPEPNQLRMAANGSPLNAVYEAGYQELQAQMSGGDPHAAAKPKNPAAAGVQMQLASADQVRRLERNMPWLATTGSVTPFIGLFGTVWGVMDAFSGLGEAGSASLRVVAPGIAEALITTAAGLATAIPAVIAYNQFVSQIRGLATRMDNFTMEFLSMIETMYS
jgi:biopolymer transport protein TolQ